MYSGPELFTCLLHCGSLPAESNHQFICVGISDEVCYQRAREEEVRLPDGWALGAERLPPLFILIAPCTASSLLSLHKDAASPLPRGGFFAMPCVDVLPLQLHHMSVYQLHQPSGTSPIYLMIISIANSWL